MCKPSMQIIERVDQEVIERSGEGRSSEQVLVPIVQNPIFSSTRKKQLRQTDRSLLLITQQDPAADAKDFFTDDFSELETELSQFQHLDNFLRDSLHSSSSSTSSNDNFFTNSDDDSSYDMLSDNHSCYYRPVKDLFDDIEEAFGLKKRKAGEASISSTVTNKRVKLDTTTISAGTRQCPFPFVSSPDSNLRSESDEEYTITKSDMIEIACVRSLVAIPTAKRLTSWFTEYLDQLLQSKKKKEVRFSLLSNTVYNSPSSTFLNSNPRLVSLQEFSQTLEIFEGYSPSLGYDVSSISGISTNFLEQSRPPVRCPPPVENASPDTRRTLIRTLIKPASRSLVTQFTSEVLNQMEITAFTASDKRGNRGKIPIGFPGLSCLHCQGRNCTRKAGRYFPASIRVLSNQTTLFVMYNHLRGCESIPEEVKRSLIKHYNRHRKENQHKTRVVGGKASFFKGVWDCLQHQSENPLS